jgi:hypothetical protein
MEAQLFSNPAALEELNAGTAYLQALHDGRSPQPPGLPSHLMAAAMKVWIDARKHLLYQITADFKDIKAASAAGKPIAAIRAQLAARIECFNGVFLPEFMESLEAATGTTPLEGWLFARPPQKWRVAKKADMTLNPIDDPRCFWTAKRSPYMQFLSSAAALDPRSVWISATLNSSILLAMYAGAGGKNPAWLLAEAGLFLAFVIVHMAYIPGEPKND